MIPKTKIQKEIIGLRDKLPKITKSQEQHAYTKHSNLMAIAYKTKHYCLECGYDWNADQNVVKKNKGGTCPSCKTKLRLLNFKGCYRQTYYYGIITTIGNYQVVRVYYSNKFYRKKHIPEHSIYECMQHYVSDKGTLESIALQCVSMSYFYDQWQLGTELEFRTKSDRYKQRISLDIDEFYPKKKILPILKRNGIKTSFHGLKPHFLFRALLTNNFIETLFKSGQYKLIKHLLANNRGLRYTDQFKIALRHNYKITNVNTYIDYLGMLEDLEMDLRNPKFICPSNLDNAHYKVIEKRRKQESKRQYERDAEKRKIWEQQYQEQKQKYFELLFADNDLVIQPLKSVEDFYKEYEMLKHCVYLRKYFLKQDTLILSAKLGDKHIETVEVDLINFKILQSRGKFNKPTKLNKRIKRLVQTNMKQIIKKAS